MNIGSSGTPIHDTNAINAGSSAGNVNLTIYGQSLGTGTLRAYTDLYSTLHLYSGNYTQHSGNVYLSSTDNDTPGIDVSNEDDSYGNVTLRGGTLTISATGTGSNAITASSDVRILGGTLHAECGPTESGYNAYGIYSQSGNITLDWTNASDRIYATSYYVVVNELNPNGAVKIASGKALVEDGNDNDAYNNYVIGDGNALSGEALGNIAGKTLKPALLLTDNVDNSAQIAALNHLKTTAILQDRTLYRDGAWNTLCLPFSVGDEEATSGHELDGTPLEGATLMTLGNQGCNTGFDTQTSTLTLDFLPATTVEPGVAYIVKWGTKDNHPDTDIENPVFTGVTVTTDTPADHATSSQDEYITFIGTYSPTAIYADPATNLYLGNGNKLYYPSSKMNIGSFRAYFRLNNGLTAGLPDPDPDDGSGSVNIRAFKLNFGNEEETTGIISTTNYTNYTNSAGAGWYDLSGRKLQGKPTAKGIYIYNGKKRVITGW